MLGCGTLKNPNPNPNPKYNAIEPYAELVESWRDTENHWRYKYLTTAMKHNPRNGKDYRIPALRLLPKLGKDDARDVSGVHVAANQPFALLDSILLSETVRELPHFLSCLLTLYPN
eukprot:SAG31_NODE_2342_length_5912_cov_1.363152_3_plen_116_part_00